MRIDRVLGRRLLNGRALVAVAVEGGDGVINRSERGVVGE